MSTLKLSAKDFVKNVIFPALHSSINSEYEFGKSEIFSDNNISKIKLEYIREFEVNKKFFYGLKPNCSFRKVQEELNKSFLSKVPINFSSKAYRSGMSYLHFLEPHIQNYKYLRLDVKNCFHSISHVFLRECFSAYFLEQKLSSDSDQFIVDGFINLVTMEIDGSFKNKDLVGRKIIPVGFTTSPYIVNIVFRKIDILIERLCSRYNITYTRYADDLLFSEPVEGNVLNSDFFKNEVKIILSELNLKLNVKKTIFKSHTISLNGFVIQSRLGKNYSRVFKSNNISDYSGIRISNKKLKNIKTAINLILDGKVSPQEILRRTFGNNIWVSQLNVLRAKDFSCSFAKSQLVNKLSGYRSFLISLLIFNEEFNCTAEVVSLKYKEIIKSIDKAIAVL